MGDENDDFLDDTIEFGDGTQYKIIEELKQENSPPDELSPPHPSLAAQLERPLGRDESPGAPVERVERFQDDFNRRAGSGGAPHGGPPKALFNAKDGRLEPYAGPPAAAAPGSKALHRSAHAAEAPARGGADRPAHLASVGQGRRPSVTGARPGAPPMAWGKPVVQPAAGRAVPEQDYPTLGAGPPPGRRASNDHGGRRPSFNAPAGGGERELPPHLRGNAPPPRQTPSAILSPPRARQPSLTAPPPAPAPAPEPAPPTSAPIPEATPTAPVVDIEELHRRELHAGAERARARRQKEEEENDARKERMRKKADELAAKMEAEEAARKAKDAPPPPAPAAAPAVVPAALKSPVLVNGAGAGAAAPPVPTPAATVNSWRKPLVATGPAQDRPQPTHFQPPPQVPHGRPTVVPASAAAAQLVGRTQPTQILARQGPPHLAHAQEQPLTTPAAPPARDPAPHVQARTPSAKPAVPVLNPASTGHAPSPAVGGHARSPSDASERRGRTRTSSVSSKQARSPTVGHVQEMSSLEAVMSRVKLEMASQEASSPSPNGREPHAVEKPEGRAGKRTASGKQAKATEAASAPVPVVRLPGKGVPQVVQEEVAASSVDAPSAVRPKALVPEVRLPSSLQVQRGRSDRLVTSPAALGAHAAAAAGPAQPPPIPHSSRPPISTTPSTREPRAASPPPVWRRYAVKLAPARPRRPVPAKQLAAFRAPAPSLLDPLTWVPQLKGLDSATLSRDDWLLPNWQKDKGPRAWVVSLPRRRLGLREVFARRAGDEVQEAFETRRGEEELFEKPSKGGRVGVQRVPSVSGKGKGTCLAGGALTSSVEEVAEREVVEGVVVEVETVTVTSGLGGEEVVGRKAGKELAAPGAVGPVVVPASSDAGRRLSISYTTTTTTTTEPKTHPASPLPPKSAVTGISPLRAPVSPGWGAAPTSSVLDPSTPGLWSAPAIPARDARSRAVSHDPSTLAKAVGAKAAVNSLQGLVGAEEDDVTAALPQSMEALALGFRSDEGEAEAVSHKPHGHGHGHGQGHVHSLPRLSAAAPEFAAFVPRAAGVAAGAGQSDGASAVLGLTSGAGAAVAAQFPAAGYPRGAYGGAAVHARQASSPAQFDAVGGYGHAQHASLSHGHAHSHSHSHSHSAYGAGAAESAYLAGPYSPAGVSPYSPVTAAAPSVPSAPYGGRGSAYAPQGYVHGREGYPGYASSPTASASAAAYAGFGSSDAPSPVQQSYYGGGYAARAPAVASTPATYAAQSPVQQAYGSHHASVGSGVAGQGGYGVVARGGSYGAVGGVGAAAGSARGSVTGARPVNVGPAGNGYGRPGLHSTTSLGGSAAYGASAYGSAAYGVGAASVTGPGSAPGSIHHSPAGGVARPLSAIGGAVATTYGAGAGAGGVGGMSEYRQPGSAVAGGREGFVSTPYVGGPSPVLMPAALPARGYGGASGQGQQGYGQGIGARGSAVGAGRAYW